MGVFDAMTTVVLEAGRMDPASGGKGGGEGAPAVPEPRPWRFRLPYMPALGALVAAVLVVG
ncbi:hypothetical protein [Azospirillum rugosum]|uniref:Uncharacterized protein n=1 Tax=Azospirillum rugosum TaxID=416170 RepID=A0ABS4SVR1_9PROT|nr:hypothetical protein [Azospirillum rugosum]MBP2296653.1 hypothetical protein [Azospirillum rugosum]MDQ0530288.1 hypothetical protein [Azospirillum rugosum]